MIDYSKFEGHTPGPWEAAEEYIVAGAMGRICMTATASLIDGSPLLNWEANGELIAAAPDLLEENKLLRRAIAEIRILIDTFPDSPTLAESIDQICYNALNP